MSIAFSVAELTRKLAATLGRKSEVEVVFRGNKAHTDGTKIYLPALPEGKVLDQSQWDFLMGYLDHEIGHVRNTDFGVTKQVTYWLNLIEDIRTENLMIQDYPGSKKYLDELHKLFYQDVDVTNPTLTLLLAQKINSFRGHPNFFSKKLEDFPELARYVDLLEEIPSAKSTVAVLDIARRLEDLLNQEGEGIEVTETSQLFTDKQKKDQSSSDQESAESSSDQSSSDQESDQSSSDPSLSDPSLSDPSLSDQSSSDQSSSDPSLSDPSLSDQSSSDQESDQSFSDPSLPDPSLSAESSSDQESAESSSDQESAESSSDQSSSDHSSDQSSSSSFILEKGDDSFLEKALDRSKEIELMLGGESRHLPVFDQRIDKLDVAPFDKSYARYQKYRDLLGLSIETMWVKVRRAFELVNKTSWTRDLDEGELDTQSLWKVGTGSKRVYRKRSQTKAIDTALSVMVDLSSSMDDITTLKTVIALCELTERIPFLKVRVAGFYCTSKDSYQSTLSFEELQQMLAWRGRTGPMTIVLFKKYEDINLEFKAKVGGLFTTGSTPLGDAYAHGLMSLLGRKEQRKIYLFVTDGCPNYDRGTNEPYTDYTFMSDKYKEFRKYGIEVWSLSLDYRADEMEECSDPGKALTIHSSDFAQGVMALVSEIAKPRVVR